MIGVIVAAHGALARELLQTASLFCSNQASTAYVEFAPTDSPEELYAKLNEAVRQVDQGKGIFILTDLEGGSPSNQASRLLIDRKDIELIAGVNLPMLLTVLMEREGETVESMKEAVVSFSRKSIVSLNDKIQSRAQKARHEDDMDQVL